MKWHITAVLLGSFQPWDLLPSEIRENYCEDQEFLMRFVADGVPDSYNSEERNLPSAEAIMVEISRILLGTIPEWNGLEPSLQTMLEHEIIEFIGQDHEEMKINIQEDEMDPQKKYIKQLESNHNIDHKPANYSALREEARQKIVKKIAAKITSTIQELELDGLKLDRTTGADIDRIQKSIALSMQKEITPSPKPREKLDTIPASPDAKRKSDKPAAKK